MNHLIDALKEDVKKLAGNPSFIHHEWFVTYHLEIVEKIALELCEKYPQADKDIVLLLVWFHDYGKIIDYDHEHEQLTEGKKKLLELGFSDEVAERVTQYVEIFDKKENLLDAPIEVQIVSSADGASHFVGPFYELFWKEFHDWSCEKLREENERKATVDWEKKIVLPEVKEAFSARYQIFLEHCSRLPEKYFPNRL